MSVDLVNNLLEESDISPKPNLHIVLYLVNGIREGNDIAVLREEVEVHMAHEPKIALVQSEKFIRQNADKLGIKVE